VKCGRPLPCRNYAVIHDLGDDTLQHHPDAGQSTSSTGSLRSPSQENESSSRQVERDEPVDITETESLSHKARYCCLRSSPLVCPNHNLVNEIDIIRLSRHLEGEERSMLGYARAISVSIFYIVQPSYIYYSCVLGHQGFVIPVYWICKNCIQLVAYPRVITECDFQDLHELPYLGEKLQSMVLSQHLHRCLLLTL